jgi:hypothetical protein
MGYGVTIMYWKDDRESEDGRNYSNRNRHAINPTDCDHDMQYSATLGVIGGVCRKCGYRTI